MSGTCECCEESEVEVIITLTKVTGEILDSRELCKECTAGQVTNDRGDNLLC
jgi:hypothetical protein